VVGEVEKAGGAEGGEEGCRGGGGEGVRGCGEGDELGVGWVVSWGGGGRGVEGGLRGLVARWWAFLRLLLLLLLLLLLFPREPRRRRRRRRWLLMVAWFGFGGGSVCFGLVEADIRYCRSDHRVESLII